MHEYGHHWCHPHPDRGRLGDGSDPGMTTPIGTPASSVATGGGSGYGSDQAVTTPVGGVTGGASSGYGSEQGLVTPAVTTR